MMLRKSREMAALQHSANPAAPGSFEIWHSTGGVPDSEDADGISPVIYLVDNPIWPQDDFSYGLFCFLGDDSIGEGEFGCLFNVVEDVIRETGSSNGVVQADELNDLLEVLNSRLRPDYPASHRFRLSLTSS